jgi:two-component system chemotaxis response regulator CheY
VADTEERTSEMAKTALIVDDSTTMRQMVAFTLREAGYQVVEAEHGQDALNKITAQPVNIVITDLNMPVMDGFTFIQNVRAMPTYKFLPILMLTTESQLSKKEQGKAVGATGWIIKPFDPDKLLQVVAKVLP